MPGELLIHYGNPGSGKTLFAMKEIVLPAVKNNRPFFTNITGISVSALSALTGIHQAFIKYYVVNDISDVIRYFDDEKISHDGVFILDEMKDFINDEKAVQWLESRLNVMRKHSVDFVFIAQQCKKEYIHPNLVGLANACNVYRTRKRENDPNRVYKYYVNGGVPKIIDNDVANAVGKEIVRKPVEMYNTYETSESAFYSGAENDTYFGLKWYQERVWKLRFVLIGIVLFGLVSVGYIIYSLFGAVHDLNKEPEVGNEKQSVVEKHVERADARSVEASDLPTCFHWKVCTQSTCETDIGTFPAINEIDSRLCTPTGICYSKCQGDNVFSSRGRLLRTGSEVSEGTGRRLRYQ